MSSYISVENQTLLWNTIQKVQLLHDRLPTHLQQDWFKNILGTFYKKSVNTPYDLVQLNKETIGYMISSLKQESYSQEYTKKEPPNLKEEMGDGVIENMDELLQQQLKQRELDFAALPNKHLSVDPSIRKEIDELQRVVKLLQDEIALIKSKSVTDTKEVTE